MPKNYLDVTFRATSIESDLTARGTNVHQTARRDLERYYGALRRSLPKFDESGATLLVSALNGVITTPETVSLLWATVDDFARQYGKNAEPLVARLRALRPFELLAVVDACERFWLLTDGETAERLRAVGLVQQK